MIIDIEDSDEDGDPGPDITTPDRSAITTPARAAASPPPHSPLSASCSPTSPVRRNSPMETAESKPVTAQDSASESASATSDDHVTSTTQSPGAKLNTNQDTVDFSVLETDIASLRNKAFPEIIGMVPLKPRMTTCRGYRKKRRGRP